jgi:hypothetical protein
MVAHARVRHEAMRLDRLVVVITKMGIFDSGVRVLARDSVDLGAVATFLDVKLETARHAFDLQRITV